MKNYFKHKDFMFMGIQPGHVMTGICSPFKFFIANF